MFIPKPGQDELRPLSIPAIRDRVVQAALKIVLEPVFEADMLPCSFGFRPKRSAHDALQVVIDESFGNKRWVVETDIASCFTAIPHDGLMSALSEGICDRKVLALLHAFLRAGAMEDGTVRRPVSGTPQGGANSPGPPPAAAPAPSGTSACGPDCPSRRATSPTDRLAAATRRPRTMATISPTVPALMSTTHSTRRSCFMKNICDAAQATPMATASTAASAATATYTPTVARRSARSSRPAMIPATAAAMLE